MESETNYFKIYYPISPAFASSLKGVMATQQVSLGTFLSFHGNKYQVHKIRPIKAKLFVANGKLKFYQNEQPMESRDKQIALLTRSGFADERAFNAAFFTSGLVSNSTIERDLFLVCFVSDDPFEVKW